MRELSPKHRVLVVDDEASVRESLRILLSRQYEVATAESSEQARRFFLSTSNSEASSPQAPDVVLLDVMMPGTDGVMFLKEIKQSHPTVPVIMLSASTALRTAVQAMKLGAVDYVSKPYEIEELLNLIQATLAALPDETEPATGLLAPRRADRSSLRGDFGRMSGQHPLMLQLYQQVEHLAERDTTVLITGESGTGKELVAREIHDRSARSKGPFVALNCAAIPEPLIESELFGHEKGAFTHAVDRRIGHFEMADGGTLFLDEIGELNQAVQVKLLRVLQEQEFYRVGRSKPIQVDVRILAATNRSLEAAMREGKFRHDLFYRINVVAVEIPALRDRKEDVSRLFDFFVRRLSPLYGDRVLSLDGASRDALEAYSWPGNVRELENVAESLLALNHEGAVEVRHLPTRIRAELERGENTVDGAIPFEEAGRAFERDMILKALARAEYVQTRAAELLGISRRILKYKMDKLGIPDRPPS